MFSPIYIPEIKKEDFDELLKLYRYRSDELMKPDDLDNKLDSIMEKPPIKKSEKDKEIDRLMEIYVPLKGKDWDNEVKQDSLQTQTTTPINEKIIIQQSFWNTVAVWIGAIGAIGVLAVAVYPSIKKEIDDYYKEKRKAKEVIVYTNSFIEDKDLSKYKSYKIESNTFYNYSTDLPLSNYYFISTKEDWLFMSNYIYKKGLEAGLKNPTPNFHTP